MKSKALCRERDQSCIAHYQNSLVWLNSTIYYIYQQFNTYIVCTFILGLTVVQLAIQYLNLQLISYLSLSYISYNLNNRIT